MTQSGSKHWNHRTQFSVSLNYDPIWVKALKPSHTVQWITELWPNLGQSIETIAHSSVNHWTMTQSGSKHWNHRTQFSVSLNYDPIWVKALKPSHTVQWITELWPNLGQSIETIAHGPVNHWTMTQFGSKYWNHRTHSSESLNYDPIWVKALKPSYTVQWIIELWPNLGQSIETIAHSSVNHWTMPQSGSKYWNHRTQFSESLNYDPIWVKALKPSYTVQWITELWPNLGQSIETIVHSSVNHWTMTQSGSKHWNHCTQFSESLNYDPIWVKALKPSHTVQRITKKLYCKTYYAYKGLHNLSIVTP